MTGEPDKNLHMAQEIGKQMAPGHPDTLYCPECSEGEFKQPLTSMGDFRQHFFCPHCEMACTIIVDTLPCSETMVTSEKPEQVEEQEEPGKFTPKMVNYLLCRLLEDVDGVTVAGKFFKDIPLDTGWEAQYDEVNDIWRFFVRSPRKRKEIYKLSKKVIG